MPDIQHLTPELLQALARGDSDSNLLGRCLEGHSLIQCATCREAYEAYLQELSAGHEAVLDRMPEMVRQAETERDRALRWVAQLRPLSQDERLARIHQARTRYRGEGFVRVLLTQSRDAVPTYPTASGQWAAAAEEALDLSGLDHPELKALAVAYRGNALRALGDLPGARRSFSRVFQLITEHEDRVSVMTQAEILRLAATLFLYDHDFDRAGEALESAALAYIASGQVRDALAVTIKLGILHEDRGELERAIGFTSRALKHLDPDEEPELYAVARCNLANQTYEAGRAAEARQILEEDADRLAAHPEPFFQVRLTVLQGKLAAAEGDAETAETAFCEAREAFAQDGSAFAFATVSLDLASLYLEQGRMAEVSTVAVEMLRIFEAQEVHLYAYAALRLFAEAAHKGSVTAELVDKLTAYLHDAERDPAAVFRGVN